MAGAVEHFEDAAHDLIAPLDRLIRIGIGADRDRLWRIIRRRQFALKEFGRVRLHEQFGFEIEAGGEPEIGMRGPRETINAAVLAAAVRIDRAIKRDVGRIVAGDDLAGGVGGHCGLERRQLLQTLPAVIESDPRHRLVPAGGVRGRAAAAAAFAIDASAMGARVMDATAHFARRRGGQRCRRAFQRGRTTHGHSSRQKANARTRTKQEQLFVIASPLAGLRRTTCPIVSARPDT